MALNNTIAQLCVKGCGFYGSEENKNMCSKCYKDILKTQLIAKSETNKASDVKKPLNPNVDFDSSCSANGGSVKINRCKNCNKKIGLTGFKCRCGHMFCGMHRYPQEHSCTFNFKKADRDLLIKQNPLVNADKLEERI